MYLVSLQTKILRALRSFKQSNCDLFVAAASINVWHSLDSRRAILDVLRDLNKTVFKDETGREMFFL